MDQVIRDILEELGNKEEEARFNTSSPENIIRAEVYTDAIETIVKRFEENDAREWWFEGTTNIPCGYIDIDSCKTGEYLVSINARPILLLDSFDSLRETAKKLYDLIKEIEDDNVSN